MYPESYKYTNDHEWLEPATGRIGVTDYAQKQLGDIVFLDLPQVGKVLKKGEQVATVESVKAVSEVFAPVSGTVVEVNTALAEKPEGINEDAHASWIVKLELSDPADLQGLMDSAKYTELTK